MSEENKVPCSIRGIIKGYGGFAAFILNAAPKGFIDKYGAPFVIEAVSNAYLDAMVRKGIDPDIILSDITVDDLLMDVMNEMKLFMIKKTTPQPKAKDIN